jgi:hypothetical protein
MNRFLPCLAILNFGVLAVEASVANRPMSFARDVLPILSDKCFACHGPDAKAKDLKLFSYEEATRPRDGIRAINPGDLEKSELLTRIHDVTDPMPPEDAPKKLSVEERQVLSRWVRSGGVYEQHWAFTPPLRHPGFETIDEYIGVKLAEHGIGFAREADRRTLARRVALVLTGMLPDEETLEAFVASDAPGAYEVLVDQLLSSERYGEHQARYWLDAVRYGDTAGLARDARRGVSPYRDWVIQALNDNLPLDQFIIWQLAGDLLPKPTLEQTVATGYVRMNPTTNEGGSLPEEFQAKNNFDRVENLGTVFLGLSLICARCHTHKYDPVTQQEYYQLLAFFNNTAEKPLDGYKYDHPPVARAPRDIADWKDYRDIKAIDPATLSDFQTNRLAEIEERMATTLVAKEGKRRPTFLLARGDYMQPVGERLKPGVIEAVGPMPTGAPKNRLGLAQWLTSRDHPLVARVLVNRIWSRVFGVGLVRTPEDFGLQGEHPTHPELLDHLALELHDSGWNLKAMLKRMVMSRAFRQASHARPEAPDPENRLYARGPSFRLDAEVIRDITLQASGLLDPTMGGPGVKPYQPEGMWESISHRKSNTRFYEPDTDRRIYRRSIYMYWKRASPHPMMTLFDAPNRETACVGRVRTDTPLQSLALWNEPQRVESARVLAERLIGMAADNADRLNRLFLQLTGRAPNPTEAAACIDLLEQMRREYQANPSLATELIQVGDTPTSPELNPIELAAWTQVTATLLASDPVILLY